METKSIFEKMVVYDYHSIKYKEEKDNCVFKDTYNFPRYCYQDDHSDYCYYI